jgi:hypothetical protein
MTSYNGAGPRIRVTAQDVQILVELIDERYADYVSYSGRKLDRHEILALERLRLAAANRFRMTWLK